MSIAREKKSERECKRERKRGREGMGKQERTILIGAIFDVPT